MQYKINVGDGPLTKFMGLTKAEKHAFHESWAQNPFWTEWVEGYMKERLAKGTQLARN